MEYKGSDMKLDFKDTWRAGQKHLPNMARHYAAANRGLSAISVSDSGNTKFLNEWNNVRDVMQSVLGDSSNNLEATANALLTAFEDFVEKDDGNGEAMDALDSAKEDITKPNIPETVEPE